METTTDYIIQYSIVGLILLGVCIWIIVSIFKKNKKGKSGTCCGCSLAESCGKKDIINKKSNCGNSKNLQQ